MSAAYRASRGGHLLSILRETGCFNHKHPQLPIGWGIRHLQLQRHPIGLAECQRLDIYYKKHMSILGMHINIYIYIIWMNVYRGTIMLISSHIFLFLESTSEALHDSLFKINSLSETSPFLFLRTPLPIKDHFLPLKKSLISPLHGVNWWTYMFFISDQRDVGHRVRAQKRSWRFTVCPED